jgi:hypothetical protein
MSRNSYEPILVRDSRLAVSESFKYGVMESGRDITIQRIPASSKSTSQWNASVNIPSQETTRISREIYLETEFVYRLSFTKTAGTPIVLGGADPINIGYSTITATNNTAFANVLVDPLPFQQLHQNLTATINNEPISENLNQTLNEKLRLIPSERLAGAFGASPYRCDLYQSFTNDRNALNGNSNPNFQIGDLKSRASFCNVSYENITGTANADTVATVDVVVRTREPLMMSPFSFRGDSDNTSLYSVNKLEFTGTLNPQTPVLKMLQTFGAGDRSNTLITGLTSQTLVDLRRCDVILTYLQPPAGMEIPTRCVLPMSRLSTFSTSISQSVAAGASQEVNANAVILKDLPDGLLLYARRLVGNRTAFTPSSVYLPITAVNVQFNTAVGLLSTANTNDFYRISRENGVNMDWEDFYGTRNIKNINADAATSAITRVSSAGALCYFKLAKDIAIDDPMSAPGVSNSFTFQIRATVVNNSGALINPNEYELVVCAVDSGFFVSENFNSYRLFGGLSYSDVAKAKSEQEPYFDYEMRGRMVGGSMWSNVKSAVKWLAPKLPRLIKSVLSEVNHPYARTAVKALDAVGAGSGSGMSGAGNPMGSGMSAAGLSAAGLSAGMSRRLKR